MASEPNTVVLVEGESDRQAVLALARRLDRDLAAESVEVLAMGGATQIGAQVWRLSAGGVGPYLVGLCDVNERRHFERVLDVQDLFVCDVDLEDELIRAVGLDEIEAFIEAQDELRTFRTYQKQPAQRTQSLQEQAHRFCGTFSGRKIRYAQAMIDWVPLERVPEPLRSLLDAV